MCPNKDMFDQYESISGGSVLIENNSTCKTIGIDNIKISMFDSIVRTLTDVRHVPDLKKNILSLGTLYLMGRI